MSADGGGFEFSTVFTTRYAEMNINGKLSVANIFRYFEAARWDSAEATAEFLRDTPTRPGRMVVRSQRLTVFEPVSPAIDLHFGMWVEQVGNTSMLIGQEAVQVNNGRRLAEASVLVVQTDETGRPMPFEPPARRLLNPRGLVAPGRLHAPVTNAAFSWDYRVSLSDLDVLQHMNHARYVSLSDDTWVHAVNSGAISDRVQSMTEPATDWPVPNRTTVRQITIEYFQEALLGQTLLLEARQGEGQSAPVVTVEGKRAGEERPVFRAELVLEPIVERFSLTSLRT